MLQICDGTTLWDYSKILDSQNYRRLEIGKVLKRLEAPEFDATTREYAIAQLGITGPDALLAGLRKAIKFDRKESATLAGRAVWFLQGSWKDLGALVGPGQAVPPVGAPLPPYVPSLASVWIGQEDGWPYQVLLEGRVPTVLLSTNRPKLGPDGRPAGRATSQSKEPPSKFLLTYSQVQLDQPIDRGNSPSRRPRTPGSTTRPRNAWPSWIGPLSSSSRPRRPRRPARKKGPCSRGRSGSQPPQGRAPLQRGHPLDPSPVEVSETNSRPQSFNADPGSLF
jgi:hypothetical protein